jgi:hypothetical protein
MIFGATADITWPMCLPDLAELAHVLWGYIKTKVYETHPAKLMTLYSEFGSVFKGSLKKW